MAENKTGESGHPTTSTNLPRQVADLDSTRRFSRFEKVSLLVQVLFLVVTAIYAGVAYFQFRAMRGQLDAMIESNRMSRQNSVDAARETRESLDLTRRQVLLSELALGVSRESLEATQRAWIVLRGLDKPLNLSTDRQVISFDLENVGRSPAMQVVSRNGWSVLPIEITLPHDPLASVKLSHIPYITVIGPGQTQRGELPPIQLQQQDIVGLQSGSKVFYAYAGVEYRDQFQISRLLRFCLFFDPKLGRWLRCTHYQEVR